MFTSENRYKIIESKYATKHFLFKRYSKKKLRAIFKAPKKSLFLLLEKIDLALNKKLAESITDSKKDLVICKVEFKIYPKESPKTSGNRCIVVQDKIKNEVLILFAYHKNDVSSSNETVWWKKKVLENFPEYSSFFSKI